jgi:hypothetical protein
MSLCPWLVKLSVCNALMSKLLYLFCFMNENMCSEAICYCFIANMCSGSPNSITVTSLFGYNSNIFTAITFLWLSIHQSISYDTNISIQNAISPYDTNIVCCSIILTFLPQTYLHPKCC